MGRYRHFKLVIYCTAQSMEKITLEDLEAEVKAQAEKRSRERQSAAYDSE